MEISSYTDARGDAEAPAPEGGMTTLAVLVGVFVSGAFLGRWHERERPGRSGWNLLLFLAVGAAMVSAALLLHAEL